MGGALCMLDARLAALVLAHRRVVASAVAMTLHTQSTTEQPLVSLSCACERTAIRLRTQSNGVQIYALQCLECGRQLRAVSKQSPEVLEMPNRLPFDETLRARWDDAQREHWARQRQSREDAQQRKDTAWWREYDAYLKTPVWQQKRAAVMARSGGCCEGCATRLATQVHHLSYAHVGHELLFELVAVCDACHRTLHPEMD